MRFPDNKRFAFSIVDDTDLTTTKNVAPVYQLLNELGIHTTKTVWPLAADPHAPFTGASLQDPSYRDFVLGLRNQGFEIALHNVRNTDSTRQEIEQGLDEFCRLIGYYPRVHANHFNNRDNIYWGAARFSTFVSSLYSIATGGRRKRMFEGHVADSDHFWGDLCKQRIAYVRNLVFKEINIQRINPSMPYYDPAKPLVNAWFSSADGSDKDKFCKLLSETNQDSLEEEAGTCIVYTHFACGFSNNGQVDPRVAHLLRRLVRKNGWFAPVSSLLDFLHAQHGTLSIPSAELAAMERRWLAERVVKAASYAFGVGGSRRTYRAPVSGTPEAEQAGTARVVHVTSGHGPDDPRIFYSECRSLARAGYEVTQLATLSPSGYMNGVRMMGIGPPGGRLRRMTTTNLIISREAIRQGADIYHIHDPELLPLALLLHLLGKQVLYDIHEDVPKTVLYKNYIPASLRPLLMRIVESLENMVARRMTGLIAATPAICERFRKVNVHTETVCNFPDTNDLAPAVRRRWSERRVSVAYIGGISEERGIRELMASIPKMESGAKLELAGWFWNSSSMLELMNSPEWSRVLWHGMLDRIGVAELLGNVRAGLTVLHPEQNFLTSLPVKMFEYMAAGIPVIASDFPLWREIIQTADCGILVDPSDPSAIAEAINFLLSHNEEAEAMGSRGRRAVEEHFNWECEESKLLAFYRSITHPNSKERAVISGRDDLEVNSWHPQKTDKSQKMAS